jgi:hypothetical protein
MLTVTVFGLGLDANTYVKTAHECRILSQVQLFPWNDDGVTTEA